MKNALMVIALILLCCFIAGIAFWILRPAEPPLPEPAADVEADIQAIRDISDKWQIAINAGDLDTLMSFYAEDTVKIPPNEPVIVGKEAVRSIYQKHFAEHIRQEKHEIVDIKVNGELAINHMIWSWIDAPKVSGESGEPKGNGIRVFQKQSDGTWRVIYMIWSDESLVPPTQAE